MGSTTDYDEYVERCTFWKREEDYRRELFRNDPFSFLTRSSCGSRRRRRRRDQNDLSNYGDPYYKEILDYTEEMESSRNQKIFKRRKRFMKKRNKKGKKKSNW